MRSHARLWRCLALLAMAGCAQNPLALQSQNNSLKQQQMAMQQRTQEVQARVQQLDQDNQELQTVVAQSKQQSKLLEDQVAALKDQLSSTSSQLAQLRQDKQLTEKQVEAMAQSTTRRRTGAIITANSSLQRGLPTINLPGVEVRTDGDVVRIELPSDRLFAPNSAQLSTSAGPILDATIGEIMRTYPDQMLGLEGHTDSELAAGQTDNLQFSTSRALAVYQYLTSRRQFAANQLFAVGHGANHPIVSNATPSGRARNNRVELVIYPDKAAR